jgi:hypothetical protein
VTFSKIGSWGQFGNQLFQISAVLGYAATHGCRPILPVWRCEVSGRRYDQEFPLLKRYYGKCSGALYWEPSFAYTALPFIFNVDLRGYFQSEKYFVHIRDQLETLFREPLAIRAQLDGYCAKFGLSDFDAVHIRCFSCAQRDKGPLDMLPDVYFSSALDEIAGSGALVVATDNKKRTQDFIKRYVAARRVHVLDFDDHLLDFFMLARANRIVISNSSFSWWAAYLGRRKQKIIAPQRYYWFGSKDRRDPFWDTRDLYPDQFRELFF